MRREVGEAIASLLVVPLGVWVWIVADGIFAPVVVDPVGPSFWPKALGAGIALLAAVDAIRVLHRLFRKRGAEDTPHRKDAAAAERPFSAWRFGSVLVLLVLYFQALPPLGYVLATPLFVLGVLMTLGVRSWKGLIVPSVGLTCVWGGLFHFGLGVPLPEGFLFP